MCFHQLPTKETKETKGNQGEPRGISGSAFAEKPLVFSNDAFYLLNGLQQLQESMIVL